MTIEQLEKFCGNAREFTKKPFCIEKWRVATDGYSLVAENGFSPIKLPELEVGHNRNHIVQMLSATISETLYSSEHLKGFLGEEETEICDPIIFNGHRVDKSRLRKVFSICDEPYKFIVSFPYPDRPYHCLQFSFGKVHALIMGMIEPLASDPRYEPLPIKTATVSR